MRGYLRFSKFAVIVRLELTVIVRGFSSEEVPVHPVKTYSELGVAVIINLAPEANEPPELSIEPP